MESAKKSLPTDASVAGVRVSNRIDRVTTYTITNNTLRVAEPLLDHGLVGARGFAVDRGVGIKTTPSSPSPVLLLPGADGELTFT